MFTPLFVVGSGRCGTTFLREILAAHSEIGITNESHAADFLVFASQLAGVSDVERRDFHMETPFSMRGIVGPDYAAPFADVFRSFVPSIFQAFHERLFPGRELRYVGDKMPDPAAVLAWKAAFPETRVVLMIRDPRDYVASARSYARRRDIATAYPHLDVSVEAHAIHWRNVYEGASSVPPPVDIHRYEQLIKDPASVAASVLSSLGLAIEVGCLSVCQGSAGFESHGTSRGVQESVGRWRTDLSSEDLDVVRKTCGSVASRYGYDLAD
jgi:hypothetical protein